MKRSIGLLLIGLSSYLTSCTPPPSPSLSLSPPSPSPSPHLLTANKPHPTRQRLSLKLTLSKPDDLKVQEGDRVMAGQVLSDRRLDRQRLEAQKRQLQLQLDRLKTPIAGPPPVRPIPEVSGLPAASFLDEVAEVERQRVKVTQAESQVMNQQRALDLLSGMPDLPAATLPHEQEVLKQRQQELDQSRAELQLAEAQLAQAQQDRQYQEYLHSLEMSKRTIALQQADLQRQEQLQRQQEQERDRSFQVATLSSQMQQLDTQLSALAAVRSPYSGKIQRISWEAQNDQNLMVELTLIADDASPDRGSGEVGGDSRGDDRGTD